MASGEAYYLLRNTSGKRCGSGNVSGHLEPCQVRSGRLRLKAARGPKIRVTQICDSHNRCANRVEVGKKIAEMMYLSDFFPGRLEEFKSRGLVKPLHDYGCSVSITEVAEMDSHCAMLLSIFSKDPWVQGLMEGVNEAAQHMIDQKKHPPTWKIWGPAILAKWDSTLKNPTEMMHEYLPLSITSVRNLQVKFDFITFPGHVEGNIGRAEDPLKEIPKPAVRGGTSFTDANQPSAAKKKWKVEAELEIPEWDRDFSLSARTSTDVAQSQVGQMWPELQSASLKKQKQKPGKSTKARPEETLSILSDSDTTIPATNVTQAVPPASHWHHPSSNPLHSDMAQQFQVFEISSSPRKSSSVSTASTHSPIDDDESLKKDIDSQVAAFPMTHSLPPDSPPPPSFPPPPPPVPQQRVEGVKDAKRKAGANKITKTLATQDARV